MPVCRGNRQDRFLYSDVERSSSGPAAFDDISVTRQFQREQGGVHPEGRAGPIKCCFLGRHKAGVAS